MHLMFKGEKRRGEKRIQECDVHMRVKNVMYHDGWFPPFLERGCGPAPSHKHALVVCALCGMTVLLSCCCKQWLPGLLWFEGGALITAATQAGEADRL
jgi:hypothetical protein